MYTGIQQSSALSSSCFSWHRSWSHASRELLSDGQSLSCTGKRNYCFFLLLLILEDRSDCGCLLSSKAMRLMHRTRCLHLGISQNETLSNHTKWNTIKPKASHRKKMQHSKLFFFCACWDAFSSSLLISSELSNQLYCDN